MAAKNSISLSMISTLITVVFSLICIVNFCRGQHSTYPQIIDTHAKTSSNSQLISNTPAQIQNLSLFPRTYSLSIRNLEQSNNFWDPTSTKSNIYMILLIVGLSILVVGSLAFCIILVIRYFRNSNHVHQIKNSNDGFQELDPDIIFPQIDYPLFSKQIGKPLQDNCVICLQTFQPQTPLMNEPVQKSQNKVSLTLCGHLLHFKCLSKWLERQPNCPLCREQFTEENVTRWQNKIHIDFSYVYRLLDLQGKSAGYNARGGQHYARCNSRQNSQIIKYQKQKMRGDSQPHWLQFYNNRPISNKQRNQKYNINKFITKNQRQKQKLNVPLSNRINISPINNDYSNYTPQSMMMSQINHNIFNQSLNSNNMTANLPTNPNKRKQVKKLKQNQKVMTRYNASKYRYENYTIQTNLQIIKIASQAPLSVLDRINSQELYALVVYAAIMDYHQCRMINGGGVKLEELAN